MAPWGNCLFFQSLVKVLKIKMISSIPCVVDSQFLPYSWLFSNPVVCLSCHIDRFSVSVRISLVSDDDAGQRLKWQKRKVPLPGIDGKILLPPLKKVRDTDHKVILSSPIITRPPICDKISDTGSRFAIGLLFSSSLYYCLSNSSGSSRNNRHTNPPVILKHAG